MKIPRHKRILSDLFIYWYAANMTNSVKKIQFIECLWIKCICGNIDKDSIFSNTNQNIYRDIPTAEKLDLHFHDFTPIIATLFNLVVRVFEDTLHIKFGNPTDVKCRVLECKKDRTKFTEALLYSLNKDDEWFLPDRYSGMQFCILKIPTLTKQTKLNSLQFGL